ncbi:MAG: hypothetical protein K6A41_01785 [Bacteroidales bacterium]|nr:hypothetical protein [Bacteroidales bacterium]
MIWGTLQGQETVPWQIYTVDEHPSIWLFPDGHALHSCYRNHFLTKEISETCLEGSHVFQGNGLYWSLRHTGYRAFGTAELRLGYGRRFGRKVCIVLRGCYLWQHARNYESTHSFTIDISAAYQMNKKLLLAVTLYNPIRMKYGVTGDEVIPMTFDVLARYSASKQVFLDVFVHKRLPKGFEIGGSVHYTPINPLYLRLVCSNQRCGLSIMLGWKNLKIQIRGDWYYRSGIIPAMDIYGFYSNRLT